MGKKPLPIYVGLSTKEFQALSAVSGEAFRLYLAVSSFAMGLKTTCYPKWSQIKEIMGKPDADTRHLKRLAKQLEDANIIARGKFGSKDRWRLLLKEQVQQQRGSKLPPQNYPLPGSKLPPQQGQNYPLPGSKLPPVNKKINKKNKNKIKIISNETKVKTISGKEIEFKIIPEEKEEQAKILHILETTKQERLLWDYDPVDILKWLEELNTTRHLFPETKAKMIKFLQDWKAEDL